MQNAGEIRISRQYRQQQWFGVNVGVRAYPYIYPFPSRQVPFCSKFFKFLI
jgi:hypothetical protein